jgi:hypothetical protein
MFSRLIRWLAVGLCVAVAARGAIALEPPPAAPPTDEAKGGAAPRIAFDAVNVNIGDVVHGLDAVATFTYRNTGDAPLHILSAKPG